MQLELRRDPTALAKVAWSFYRQSRAIRSFLQSNNSVSRPNYLRIIALASIDILLTLPSGIVNLVLGVVAALHGNPFPVYWGWDLLHTNWEPISVPYEAMAGQGTFNLVQNYFINWNSQLLAFAIFGLFGLTSEARASYWRIVCVVGAWSGWSPAPPARSKDASLGEIEFGARQHDSESSEVDIETGCDHDLVLQRKAQLNFLRRPCPSSFGNVESLAEKCEDGDHTSSRSTARITDSELSGFSSRMPQWQV